MIELGLQNVSLDENCYIMATLPSNVDKKVPVIGFVSHMDTSPDMPGNASTACIIENYQGEHVVLNEEGVTLSPKDFPEMLDYIVRPSS